MLCIKIVAKNISIIIIIITISFMQGIYTYIPETNHAPKEYNVATILPLLFVALALALMYFYISTFRSMCAVPHMAVFCSSLTSWFPGMVLTYFLNDFEIVPVASIITSITLLFTFYIRCISVVRSLYFQNFLSFFLNHISVSWNCDIYQHTCCLSLPRITMSGLLLGMVLSVCICWFHMYGYLTFSTCSYSFWYSTCSYQRFFWSNFSPVSLLLLLKYVAKFTQ
jgi:hypothetical protein